MSEKPVTILLSKAASTLVDADVAPYLNKWKWRLSLRGYACRNTWSGESKSRKTIFLHRLIWTLLFGPIPPGLQIDHKSRRPLDNRAANLRLATHSQNARNVTPGNHSSRYRGVSWHKRAGKWMARIKFNGKDIYLGLFDDESEAAKRYDAAARWYHCDFASLNFKDTPSPAPIQREFDFRRVA